MGLSQSAYVSGWLLTSYVKGIFAAIITLIALYYSTVIEHD